MAIRSAAGGHGGGCISPVANRRGLRTQISNEPQSLQAAGPVVRSHLKMEAFYRFNTRITAVIRVLSWAYYRFPENLAGGQYVFSIL